MKPVIGWDGMYSVDVNGHVWSHRRSKYIAPVVNNRGYVGVRLSRGGSTVHALVHRLVAQAYIPKPEGKDYVNHKDRNKSNNHRDNLEWVTFQENVDHALQGGNYGRRPHHDVDACVCPCHNGRRRKNRL